MRKTLYGLVKLVASFNHSRRAVSYLLWRKERAASIKAFKHFILNERIARAIDNCSPDRRTFELQPKCRGQGLKGVAIKCMQNIATYKNQLRLQYCRMIEKLKHRAHALKPID